MTEGGFFERQPINKAGLTLVIAIHAAALTALALSGMEVIPIPEPPLRARLIPLAEDPPPEPRQQPKAQAHQPQRTVVRPEPQVRLPNVPTVDLTAVTDLLVVDEPGPIVTADPPRTIDLPKEPIRFAARIDPRAELQPPYPASEQRAGNEGAVIVRVLVGTDGRVKAVEKVSAASEAFFRSTERQALRYWRFKPATLDGKPVESWQVMTVRFEMSA